MGTPVLTVVNADGATSNGSLIDEIVREGARRMLAAALEAEINAYTADLTDERKRFSSAVLPTWAAGLPRAGHASACPRNGQLSRQAPEVGPTRGEEGHQEDRR